MSELKVAGVAALLPMTFKHQHAVDCALAEWENCSLIRGIGDSALSKFKLQLLSTDSVQFL